MVLKEGYQTLEKKLFEISIKVVASGCFCQYIQNSPFLFSYGSPRTMYFIYTLVYC